MRRRTIRTWVDAARVLASQQQGAVLRVRKGTLPHPEVAGMRESIGLPEGQHADFRKLLRGGRGFHVKDFGRYYEAHVDEVHPDVSALEHLRQDAPDVYVSGSIALGAVVGTAIGKTPRAALVGAAIGGLLALLATEREA